MKQFIITGVLVLVAATGIIGLVACGTTTASASYPARACAW